MGKIRTGSVLPPTDAATMTLAQGYTTEETYQLYFDQDGPLEGDDAVLLMEKLIHTRDSLPFPFGRLDALFPVSPEEIWTDLVLRVTKGTTSIHMDGHQKNLALLRDSGMPDDFVQMVVTAQDMFWRHGTALIWFEGTDKPWFRHRFAGLISNVKSSPGNRSIFSYEDNLKVSPLHTFHFWLTRVLVPQKVFSEAVPTDPALAFLQSELKDRARVWQGKAGDIAMFMPGVLHSLQVQITPDGFECGAVARLYPHYHPKSNGYVIGNTGENALMNSLKYGTVGPFSNKVSVLLHPALH